MGTPISKNILKAGYDLTVYNRTRSKEKELVDAGAHSAATLKELAESCDIIFTMVSNDEAVEELYKGANGILEGASTGKLAIDMSTVSPATSRSITESCMRRGMDFLDAPVSGSVKPAQEGSLVILVGGSETAYLKAKPLFDVIGKLSLHLGDHGSGEAAKLAINYLLGLNLQGLAETILFANENGISTKDMLTIINEGACANGITKVKGANILSHQFPAAFALKHLAKDLRLAKQEGMDLPLFSPLYNCFQEALRDGLGEEDVMAIFKYLEKYPKNENKVFNIL